MSELPSEFEGARTKRRKAETAAKRGSFIWTLLLAVILAVLLRSFVIVVARVPTSSMEPTMPAGCRVIMNRLAYLGNRSPQRGDIVLFPNPADPDQLYVKRVLGLPGETIEASGGTVYINGEALSPDYTDAVTDDFGPFTVPDGEYFMLGDNREHSLDSRYWEDPFVAESDIKAKAVATYYPKLSLLD